MYFLFVCLFASMYSKAKHIVLTITSPPLLWLVFGVVVVVNEALNFLKEKRSLILLSFSQFKFSCKTNIGTEYSQIDNEHLNMKDDQ